MPRRKDIWRCGVIRQPLESLIAAGAMAKATVHWLPQEPAFTFLADPFAIRIGDTRHLFVERYDYRDRHGVIDVLALNDRGEPIGRSPCLKEAWHLSYPFVFSGEGETWMLPEAHRSGGLTLYRMGRSVTDWRPETAIRLDHVPVDATPLRHAGRWWLFYCPATGKASKVERLHVAYADRLTGPWIPHPRNPVRIDRASARPGGTPVLLGDRILLPVQDCSRTYGGAIRPLWITLLTPDSFEAEAGEPLDIPLGAGRDGMHTLSACGDWTFVDTKAIDRSMRGLWLDVRRRLGGFDR